MRSKYNSRKTNGYDSKKESKRAFELEYMEKAGIISDLKKQVKFELIPAQYEYQTYTDKKGKLHVNKLVCVERACTYLADFVYYLNDTDRKIVEDSKGFKTEVYNIKRKLMLHIHGIRIKET